MRRMDHAPASDTSANAANLYAAPTADVGADDTPLPGWRGLGFWRQAAVLLNALQCCLLAACLPLLMILRGGEFLLMMAGLYALLPFISVLALWPLRRFAAMRMLALLGNLACLAGWAMVVYESGPVDGRELALVLILGAVLGLPPLMALAAQFAALLETDQN